MGVDTGHDPESEWNLDDAPDEVIDDSDTSGMRLQARHWFQWCSYHVDQKIFSVDPSQHLRPYSRIVESTKIA